LSRNFKLKLEDCQADAQQEIYQYNNNGFVSDYLPLTEHGKIYKINEWLDSFVFDYLPVTQHGKIYKLMNSLAVFKF
jgi:hypothetical protein